MRIVVRAHDARRARAAQTLLANAGVDAAALVGPFRPAPEGEDIAIFPAHGEARESAAALAEAALASEQAPLAALAGRILASPPSRSQAPFHGALALDAPPKLLAGQIEAWKRAAAAEDELGQRRLTAAAFGATAQAPSRSAGELRALYIGAPHAAFLSLERGLAAFDGFVTAAFSSFAGFDHLHDEAFDAVVLNGEGNAATAISLCAALRRNAALYHTPTLVITAPGDAATANACIERGASAILESNAPCEASLGWLVEAARREQRRLATERELRALRDLIGDPRTGLFKTEAFEAHLVRLAEHHHASGRPLSVAALRMLPAHGARMPSESNWRKGFNEIASLAARLARETDCGAALDESHIVLALPAADLCAAKRMAERIASVAECTAFASGEGGAGPLVFEQSAAELQPGEGGAALMARALHAFESDAVAL